MGKSKGRHFGALFHEKYVIQKAARSNSRPRRSRGSGGDVKYPSYGASHFGIRGEFRTNQKPHPSVGWTGAQCPFESGEFRRIPVVIAQTTKRVWGAQAGSARRFRRTQRNFGMPMLGLARRMPAFFGGRPGRRGGGREWFLALVRTMGQGYSKPVRFAGISSSTPQGSGASPPISTR